MVHTQVPSPNVTATVDDATVAKLMAELGSHLEAEGTGGGEISGYHTKRISRILAKVPTYGELVVNWLILGTVEKFFGPRCHNLQIGVTHATSISVESPPWIACQSA